MLNERRWWSSVPGGVTFYLLLIVPHILALGGLFAFAWQTLDGQGSADDDTDLGGGGGGGLPAPSRPRSQPPGGGLPLPGAGQPRRRLRVGEQLADLYPGPARRGVEPREPARPPAER